MSKPLRVLLVEDSPDNARLLLMQLNRAGWSVTHERVDTARGLESALDRDAWNLVIADYAMPQFSGEAALSMVRRRRLDLPFILVSGSVGEEVAVQAMKAGADDYLFKGNLQRLAPAVERELREAERRRQARQTESELRQRDDQLLEAQRLARLGSWHLDLPANQAVWSEEAYRILGRSPGDPSLTREAFLELLAPQGRREFEEALGQPDVTRIALDCQLSTSDGAARFIHLRGGIVRGPDGTPIEAAGMLQDITERTLAEQRLRKAHDELAVAKDAAESANRAKDHFLAILSHELRTPLTPVMAVVAQFEQMTDLPEELQSDLAIIRRNVEMEARLIDDLLDLTRIIRSKMELHFEVVDAHAVMGVGLEMFQKEIAERNLQISLDLGATAHHVWADPNRLRQIFGNLLSNAVKFSCEGGQISLRSQNGERGRLVFQVSDNGIGIEPEVLPRLFNKFEQGERTITRRFGGLGLGLSIAKSLVEMHHGKIDVASEGRGKGSTFSVELDTTAADETPATDESTGAATAFKWNAKRWRILLVEDHADTRRVLAQLLGGFGFAVTSVGSVKDALEAAQGEKFNLLVSDIALPDGSGLDVIRQLKARSQIRGIAVSGFGLDADIQRSREAGFETHLIKPVALETLQKTIEELGD